MDAREVSKWSDILFCQKLKGIKKVPISVFLADGQKIDICNWYFCLLKLCHNRKNHFRAIQGNGKRQ